MRGAVGESRPEECAFAGAGGGEKIVAHARRCGDAASGDDEVSAGGHDARDAATGGTPGSLGLRGAASAAIADHADGLPDAGGGGNPGAGMDSICDGCDPRAATGDTVGV